MGVNSVSNHNHAHRPHAARTEEPASQQELAPRISTKERNDTFERKPFNINGKIGNGQNVIYGGHISSDFGKSSAENISEPDKDPSERVYGSGVTQYEKTATAAPICEQDTKTPLKNSEKILELMREICKESWSEERDTRISELGLYYATEYWREQGDKVVSTEKYADYLNGTQSAAEYLKSMTSATASEPPIYKSADEVKQEFAADASNFLADAVAKILNGGEGASFSDLGISSSDFVEKMLNSFGSLYHSSDEVSTLMKQSEDLIREFAKQISDGNEPDIYSLATELTINGENRTIGQLLNN